MAWIDPEKKKRAGKALCNRIYGETNKIAPIHWGDAQAALEALDIAFDQKPDLTVTGLNLTVKQYLLSQLPEPFKSETTAQEKAELLRFWALEEVGVTEPI